MASDVERYECVDCPVEGRDVRFRTRKDDVVCPKCKSPLVVSITHLEDVPKKKDKGVPCYFCDNPFLPYEEFVIDGDVRQVCQRHIRDGGCV